MNQNEIDNQVLAILHRVSPETADIDFDLERSIRDQVDFDSMDLMRLAMEFEKEFGISISALDYLQLATASGASRYIGERIQQKI